MARSYRLLLGGLGENPDRQGLIKTPERAAKAMLYFTKGYDQSLEGKHISFGAINTRSVIQGGAGERCSSWVSQWVQTSFWSMNHTVLHL